MLTIPVVRRAIQDAVAGEYSFGSDWIRSNPPSQEGQYSHVSGMVKDMLDRGSAYNALQQRTERRYLERNGKSETEYPYAGMSYGPATHLFRILRNEERHTPIHPAVIKAALELPELEIMRHFNAPKS